MKYVLLSMVCLLFTSDVLAAKLNYDYVGLPISRIFDASIHQAGGQVWWVDSNESNVIFIASSNGLASYDGESWIQHPLPNETLIRSFVFGDESRIYATTINDIGYFDKTNTGRYLWQSLVPQWDGTADELGEGWSVARNSKYVVFSTKRKLLTYDGQNVNEVDGVSPDGFRLFTIDDEVLFKPREQNAVYMLDENGNARAKNWQIPDDLDVKKILKTIRDELVLITMRNGIFRLNNETFEQVVPAKSFPNDPFLYHGIQARDGYIYISSIRGGIFILNEHFDVLRQYQVEDDIGNQITLAIHEDKQGNIWSVGEPNICVFSPPHVRSRFKHDQEIIPPSEMTLIDGKVYSFSNSVNLLESASNIDPGKFTSKITISEKIWDLAFKDNTMYMAAETGVFSAFMKEDGTFSEPQRIAEGINIQALALHPEKPIIYAGGDNSIIRIIKVKNNTWESKPLVGISDQFEYLALVPDSSKNSFNEYTLWGSTSDANLYQIQGIKNNATVEQLNIYDPQRYPMGKDNVALFVIDQALWIGTTEGLFQFSANEDDKFTLVKDSPEVLQTPGKDVFLLRKDKHDNWLYHSGSETGIAVKQGDEWKTFNEVFKPFNQSGTKTFFYHDNAYWFIVTNSEVYRYHEDFIEHLPPRGQLNFIAMTVINDERLLSDFTTSLPLRPVPNADNSVRISFALADHSTPSSTVYRTRISGQGHQNWTAWSTESHKDFVMLAGGEYRFEVEARDPWGRVHSAHTDFRVIPPWYLSNTAFAFYVLVAFVALALSGWLTQRWRTKRLQHQNRELEQVVAVRTAEVSAKVEELHTQQKLKDRFFANVNHEFRTPLTLTIGPLERVLAEHSPQLSNESKTLLNTSLNNAKRLLSLVGQVLDINRLEAGKVSMRVAEHDVSKLLCALVERSQPWADSNKQKLICTNCHDPCSVYVDIDHLETCVSNLLSNALKYAGKGAQIELKLSAQEDTVNISVKDSGQGIPMQEQGAIFERFYQSKNNEHQTGTGIGLALVRELIELHEGKVTLKSSVEQGSEFNIQLLRGKSHFSKEQFVEPVSLMSDDESFQTPDFSGVKSTPDEFAPSPLQAGSLQSKEYEVDRTTLLVIDDNAELRHFISHTLKDSYAIIEAENGQLGYTAACEFLPDLVISDVSMPVMDGYELSNKLKKNATTATIPIILLTAKSTKRETVMGFEAGADDYLTKPFDTSELIMRVNAHIQARKKIRDSVEFEKSKAQVFKGNDDTFPAKIVQIIENNLSVPEMSVETLASSMHMSAKTLSRKCKQHFDTSPNSLIRDVKMRHASQLLLNDQLMVSEVAYALGYESLAYFSRRFKQHTGKSPSEFIKSFH